MIKVVMIFNIKFDLEKKTYLETNLAKTPLQPSSILASEASSGLETISFWSKEQLESSQYIKTSHQKRFCEANL